MWAATTSWDSPTQVDSHASAPPGPDVYAENHGAHQPVAVTTEVADAERQLAEVQHREATAQRQLAEAQRRRPSGWRPASPANDLQAALQRRVSMLEDELAAAERQLVKVQQGEAVAQRQLAEAQQREAILTEKVEKLKAALRARYRHLEVLCENQAVHHKELQDMVEESQARERAALMELQEAHRREMKLQECVLVLSARIAELAEPCQADTATLS